MESSLQPLAAIFELNTDLLVNCVDGMTDREASRRLAGGGNSIAFLVAHLTDARHFLVDLLGAPLPNPIGDALADVRSIDELETMPPLPELLAAWRNVSGHLLAVLGSLTTSELEAPVEPSFPVSGGRAVDALTFLAQHDSYHLGQIAFLRRQIGLPAMRYDRLGSGGAMTSGTDGT